MQIIPASASAFLAFGVFDSAYTGVVAVAGSYGLYSRAETNKTGGWFLYNAAGYPAGVTGGGMTNSDPNTGAGFDNTAGFEIHFSGTSFQLYGLTNVAYGHSKAKIDGVDVAGGVSYNSSSGLASVFLASGLAPGRHVFTHYSDPANTVVCVPQYYIIT